MARTAFPITADHTPQRNPSADSGLTIREYIATEALAALITGLAGQGFAPASEAERIAREAVLLADKLITQLET